MLDILKCDYNVNDINYDKTEKPFLTNSNYVFNLTKIKRSINMLLLYVASKVTTSAKLLLESS